MTLRVLPAATHEQRAAAVVEAVAALQAGEVIAVPTDTVYGLAVGVADDQAVQQLFELKGRPRDRQIVVILADINDAADLVALREPAERLAQRFWPGPLTLVARRVVHSNADDSAHSNADDSAHSNADGATLGVRVPDCDLVRLLARSHGPLAVTSANLHGRDTPATAGAVAAMFPSLNVVIDGGPLPGMSSTVVDVTGDAPVVLRAGPISEADIIGTAAEAPRGARQP